jgi:hypothetical protein
MTDHALTESPLDPAAAGPYVEMRALNDMVVLASNCPQLNNSCNAYNPTPVHMLIRDQIAMESTEEHGYIKGRSGQACHSRASGTKARSALNARRAARRGSAANHPGFS